MKAKLLAGVAVAVFTTSGVHAQSAASADPSTQNAAPAAQADPAAADGAADQDIVVTGIRASLQRAQELKRESGAVIEAVTFEDLGKFSDQNIADALQRVPGVQIIRDDSGNGGDRASVRGLGSQYLQTTLNGRTMISVGNNGMGPGSLRSFNLDAVPTEVIGGMTLYKTPLAQNVEPGLAGSLDISTLRPLDYKAGGDVFGSLQVRGEIDNRAQELKPRFSGVVGTKLFDGTLGIFVAGLVADTRTRINTISVGYNRADLYFVNPAGGAPLLARNVLATAGAEFYNNDFTRKRRTVSAGIQWKPDANLEVYADFTYNKYNNNQLRQHTSLSSNGGRLYGGAANPLRPGEVTITGGNGGATGFDNGVVTAFTGLRNGQPAARFNLDGERFTKNESNFKYGGLNVKWSSGPLTITSDYGHSDAKYFGDGATIYSQDVPLDLSYDGSGGLPRYKVNNNIQVPLRASFWYDSQRVLKAQRDAFRLDGRYELGNDWALRTGLRAELSTVDSRAASTFIFLPQYNLEFNRPNPYVTESFGTATPPQTFTPAQVAALDAATYPAGKTFSIFPELGVPAFQAASAAGFCSVATVICGYDIRNGSLYQGAFPTQNIPGAANAASPLQFSPIDSIYARERNFAVYAALDGKMDIGSVSVDGNLGVRAVRISLSSRGFSSVRNITADGALLSQTLVPTIDRNQYWEVLPDLNLNAHPNENINLRLGIARSITLPEYADTAPSGVLTIYDRTSRNYNPIQYPDYGTFGSTQLKPMSAWSYDLTGEYYTPWRGSVIVSAFYKDISDLIFSTTAANVTVPGQTVQFQIAGPINVATAWAKGVEVGFNQPFLFLSAPFDGLGLQANYTFVETKVNSDLDAARAGIPGTSKHSANFVAYYEKYGFGTRLGLTYRSRTTLAPGIDPTFQAPVTNLDLNVTYAITRNVELNGSINNITGQNNREYRAIPIAIQTYYQRPTLYTFGARFSF